MQGVSATETGMLRYRHAKGILRQIDATRTVLRQSTATHSGKVSPAFPSSTGRWVTIALLREASERHPGISLELVESPSAKLPPLSAAGGLITARISKGIARRDAPIEKRVFPLRLPAVYP